MLRAVIFDFNGIIVDDEPIHFELFQRVLKEEEIDLTEADYYERYLGCDDRGAFTMAYREHGRALSHSKLAQLIERKAAYYQEDIKSKMRVFPGVQTLVPELAKKLPLAIASGALRNEIDIILSGIGLLAYFYAIVSAEDVTQGKPEPDIFLKALAQLNAAFDNDHPIRPSECLVIEDSREGIRGAHRAGMKCLAVTNSHPAELLDEADSIVDSLEGISQPQLEAICS
ncbi:MAG TPA: HAD family phosphatase [Candidatus Binatia bacterium]|nr:HAD family phosphatase [Candidatus Binatia bacterium]